MRSAQLSNKTYGCLTFGQHIRKCPFQRNSLTCWIMWAESQLRPIFLVEHVTTQKTYSCTSLPSPLFFPKAQSFGVKPQSEYRVTTCGHPSQNNSVTPLSPFVVLAVLLTVQLWDTACGQGDEQDTEAGASKLFQLWLSYTPLSYFCPPKYIYLPLFS